MSTKKRTESAPKPKERNKHTVYTNLNPDVEEMIKRLEFDGRSFSPTCINALRNHLITLGYSDSTWKGRKFSNTKCLP